MADTTEHMLSTQDNPLNPWTDFKAWHSLDMQLGHHTLAYLARIINSSDELSQADQDLAWEQAIEEIIRIHDGGYFIAIPKPDDYVPEYATYGGRGGP